MIQTTCTDTSLADWMLDCIKGLHIFRQFCTCDTEVTLRYWDNLAGVSPMKASESHVSTWSHCECRTSILRHNLCTHLAVGSKSLHSLGKPSSWWWLHTHVTIGISSVYILDTVNMTWWFCWWREGGSWERVHVWETYGYLGYEAFIIGWPASSEWRVELYSIGQAYIQERNCLKE
jgi:hypothetical protein